VSVLTESTVSNAVILLPKNSGLAAQASLALSSRNDVAGAVAHVRGEDVGALASEAARRGRNVFALTGEDLLDEWLACGNALDVRLARGRVAWSDPQALYGAPALCVIVPSLDVLNRDALRIAICARYANLAEPYVRSLEGRGITMTRSYVQGATETVVGAGLADLAVDIVVTGRSVRASGLFVAEVLSKSNLAVLETR